MSKHFRKRRSRNGLLKNQSSKVFLDFRLFLTDPDDREYSEILKNARRKLERPMAPAMPCERQPSIVKCIVESHESSRQQAESLSQKSRGSNNRKGVQFTVSLHFGAQIYSHSSSDENCGYESCSGQRLGEAVENCSVESG